MIFNIEIKGGEKFVLQTDPDIDFKNQISRKMFSNPIPADRQRLYIKGTHLVNNDTALRKQIYQHYPKLRTDPLSGHVKILVKDSESCKKGGRKKKVVTKKKVRKIHKGPRGGRYYISKGHKVYL